MFEVRQTESLQKLKLRNDGLRDVNIHVHILLLYYSKHMFIQILRRKQEQTGNPDLSR